MRSRLIILLAVCSNVTAAGIIRRGGARAQHHNAARFLNQTEIASNLADIQTSTLIPISSLPTPSIAASPQTSIFAATSSVITATPLTLDLAASSTVVFSMSTSSQSLSTPVALTTTLSTVTGSEQSGTGSGTNLASAEAAVVQATDTFSRLFNLAGTATNDLQPSINTPSLSSTSSPELTASLSTIFDVPSTTNIPKVAATSLISATNQAPSSIEAPLSTTTTASASQLISSFTQSISTSSPDAISQAPSAVVVPVPISSGPVQVAGAGGDTGDEFAPVTLDRSSPAPTGTATYPTAEGGNTAMAAGFNSVYKTLNEDSACNPDVPSQAYACVDGELAECQSDATYVLKSCPQGQSCYALPQPSGSVGVVVQCAVPSDAYSILAGLISSTTLTSASTSPPLQVGTVLSQLTQSVSAPTPAQPVTSSPSAQATIQSQTVAPASTVHAVTASASQDQGVDPVIESAVSASASPTSTPSTIQTQPPPQSIQSPALAATAGGAAQVHASDPESNRSPTPDSTSPPVPSSSSHTATAAAVFSVPKALFAVVTATDNDPTSVPTTTTTTTTPPTQTSQPQAAISTPGVQSSSAVGADSTFAPTGVPVNEKVAVGNAQATVTVTVTVTTTERPAPVTVISS